MPLIPENSQNPASSADCENVIEHMEAEPQESPEDPNSIQHMDEDPQGPEEPQERAEPHVEPVASIDHDIPSSSQLQNSAEDRLHRTRRRSSMRPTRRARSTVTKLSTGTQTIYMRQQITGQLRAILRNNPTGQNISRLTQNSFNALGCFWLQLCNLLRKR